MAKRDAAIHAAARLLFELIFGKVLINLKPIVDAFKDRTPFRRFAGVLQKTSDLTHPLSRPFAAGDGMGGSAREHGFHFVDRLGLFGQQDAFVFVRENFDEVFQVFRPAFEDARG